MEHQPRLVANSSNAFWHASGRTIWEDTHSVGRKSNSYWITNRYSFSEYYSIKIIKNYHWLSYLSQTCGSFLNYMLLLNCSQTFKSILLFKLLSMYVMIYWQIFFKTFCRPTKWFSTVETYIHDGGNVWKHIIFI